MAHRNTFLFLTCTHVKIARHGHESLLIVLAHLNTFLPLARGHVEVEMYDQERLLIVPGTSQYFLIPSVYRRIEISTYGRSAS